MTRLWLLGALLLALLASALLGRLTAPVVVVPSTPLPAEAVPVEVVHTIPGPERVVERVLWRTRTATVPAAAETVLCPPVQEVAPPEPAPLEGRVQVSADRHEAVEGERLVYGWTGEAVCELRRGGPWQEIVRQPFDLEASSAITTRPAERVLAPPRLETRFGPYLDSSDLGARLGLTWYPYRGRWARRLGWWAELDQGQDTRISAGAAVSWGRP